MVKEDIYIRIATKDDAVLIADLSHQTFYESFAAQNTKENMDKFLADQFTKELLMQEVGAKNNIFLLAYHHKEAAGYVRLREKNNPPDLGTADAIEIARIYVVASLIGKGIGAALMQESINIAREKNAACVWLGVWEKNQRAIDFYTRWGFQIFSQHDFILGNEVQKDWLMRKWL